MKSRILFPMVLGFMLLSASQSHAQNIFTTNDFSNIEMSSYTADITLVNISNHEEVYANVITPIVNDITANHALNSGNFIINSNNMILTSPTYCIPEYYYGCNYISAINDFNLANIHQTATGCSGGLADYTALTANLAQGESYLYSLTSTSQLYYFQYEYIGIWIDFDDNGSFEDTGELMFASSTGGEFSGVIAIPVTAPIGNHRMRVRLKYDWNSTSFSLNNSCTPYYYGETHDYTVNISAPPLCPGISSLSVSDIGVSSAKISWSCGECTGPFIVEYGPVGFTPGTENTAGTGGTIVNSTSSPASITELNYNTEYEVYARRFCEADGFSQNFGPVKFRTIYDLCTSIQTITCGETYHLDIPKGTGEFDSYPDQPSYYSGKEIIFQFTPELTGKYLLNHSDIGYYLPFLMKEANLGCDRYSWKTANQWLGILNAGTTYFLMADAPNENGVNADFTITCASLYDPCEAIPINVTCDTETELIIPSGTGAYEIPMGDYYSSGQGKEIIFSYKPETSGRIEISLSSTSNGSGAGLLIKEANDGCNGNNWKPLLIPSYYFYGGVNSDPLNVKAGSIYYIMADAATVNGCTMNLSISCPDFWDPCSSVASLNCGEETIASIPSGIGKFDGDDVHFNDNYYVYYNYLGKEVIYSFTPSLNGIYKLTINNTNNTQAHYLIKEADSCDDTGWNFMGSSSTSGYSFYTPDKLVAGKTYYLRVDANDPLTGASHSFTIDCVLPTDPCSSITTLACGEPMSVTLSTGQGGLNSITSDSPYPNKGTEKIISFTATTDDFFMLKISDYTSYGTTLYAIKEASDGCNENKWEFLGSYNGNKTFIIPKKLIAGKEYYLLLEYDNYQSSDISQTLEIICETGDNDPCTNIISIPDCGFPVTSVHEAGYGKFINCTSNYYYGDNIGGPAGKENIYEFTPTITSFYTIHSIAGTGQVSFSIKEATGGCNTDSWKCIGSASTSYPYDFNLLSIPIQLIAGTSYYLLVDANDINGASHTFEISCPEIYDPCQSATHLTCGLNYQSITIPSGAGNYLYLNTDYAYAAKGKEAIGEYTPEESGTHELEISNNGIGEVYMKKASEGCDNQNWIFLGEPTGPYYSYFNPELLKGEKYLFLFKASYYFGATLSVNISCQANCTIYADADQDGYGDPNLSYIHCGRMINGYSSNKGDCNDHNATIYPGAPEICGNQIDDNCDGQVDDGCCTIEASISVSDVVNNFSNGIRLTAQSTTQAASWLWSNGATNQSVFLTTADAAGTYSVTVTDVYGCPAVAEYVYDPQVHTSSFVLLATNSIKLQQNNTVVNGSVGVVDVSGSAMMKKNISIKGTGAFLKAPKIMLQSPYIIPTVIFAAAEVVLPDMQYNTSNITKLQNENVKDGITTTLNGNFKNMTIGKNCVVTLTGTDFGNITIGSGSKVLFTQSMINLTGLVLDEGSSSKNTQLCFSGDAVIRCKGDIEISKNSVVNPENYKVIMFLGLPHESANFIVKNGGNETINASLYIPKGNIKVGGDNDISTYMNGKFIAENIESTGSNVFWNWRDCKDEPIPLNAPKSGQIAKENQVDLTKNEFSVKAWPNPSNQQFMLTVESKSSEPVYIKVYDVLGRNIYSKTGTAIEQYRFGSSFFSGIYMVEIRQGINRKTVKLVKQ